MCLFFVASVSPWKVATVLGRISDWLHWNAGDVFLCSAFHLILMESVGLKSAVPACNTEVRDVCARRGVHLICAHVSEGNSTSGFAIMVRQRMGLWDRVNSEIGCVMLVRLFAILMILDVSFCMAKEPADTNYDEAKVPAYKLPELLRDHEGRSVGRVQWEGHILSYLSYL